MATLHLLRRPLVRFSFASFAAVPFFLHSLRQPRLSCDASPGVFASSDSGPLSGRSSNSKVPVMKEGRINPRAITQFSMGSILGVVGGLAVSTFSKTLAIIFGLTIFAIQTLESKGIHIVPTARLQQYFKNIDVRAALADNVAFKLSFGATFALAAFGSL